MSRFHDYRMFGVTLRSEIPLPFPHEATADPDITLKMESADWFAAAAGDAVPTIDGTWYERTRCADGSDFLRWPGLFEFIVSSDGRSVACRALERSSAESFQSYLLSQVLSYALIKQEQEPLHATAVVIDGVAIAFLGSSGQGKSTMAAAFVSAGCRVLTDDLLLIRDVGGVLCGLPGPPRLKLFPEAARRFLPGEASLARMNPDSNKLIIALPSKFAHAGPAPIEAFIVLDGLDESPLEITPLTGASCCMALLGATFNKRLVDPSRLRRQFEVAKEWAQRIPVKRVRYAWNLDVIGEVVREIAADVHEAREAVM